MRTRLGLWVIVSSTACGASLSFTRTADDSLGTQPRGPAQVEVFTKGRPTRPHEELGIIEGGGVEIDRMREYAGELGCDALVIPDAAQRGECLVYTAPPLMQPPPVAAGSNAPVTCIPNAPQPCYGSGGCRGNQLCTADGKSFTACDCAGSK